MAQVRKKTVPVVTVTQLAVLKRTGELERLYQWVVLRVREFHLQLDSEGDFGHEGERLENGKVVSMLKRDLRNAIANGEFPTLPNAVIDHVVKHALKKLKEAAMKELEALTNESK